MDIDNSVFIREFQERANRIIESGNGRPDFMQVENDIYDDPNVIPGFWRERIKATIKSSREMRTMVEQSTMREVSSKWSSAFKQLGRCIVTADAISGRLMEMVFVSGYGKLEEKSRRTSHPGVVAGAQLKSLLLMCLHAKCCVIGSEILLLLRHGYPDGAESRLRSLHEHLVILMLISNDTGYEISERYQDRACFEDIKHLRALKRNFRNPVYAVDPANDVAIDSQIAEAEAVVRQARRRWGRSIEEQYGWARPALPGGANLRRITFADLEKAAGMEFLRGYYLRQNNYVHAGPFATINHMNFHGDNLLPVGPQIQDERTYFAGHLCALMLGWASRAALRRISIETEEYDEILYYCDMSQTVDLAISKFREIMDRS